MLNTCIDFRNKSYKGDDRLCGWLLKAWLDCSQGKNESD